jgi:hypothetical protein
MGLKCHLSVEGGAPPLFRSYNPRPPRIMR